MGNAYLKAVAPFRNPVTMEDVGNLASGIYGAPKVASNIIGGGIGYGINKFTKQDTDADAYRKGIEFSSKVGGIGSLLETPLAPLVQKLNPATAQKIGDLMDKGLTRQAFSQLWKNVRTSAITGGIEGGAYGAVLPAKNAEQWARNIFENATQFAAYSGGTSGVKDLSTIGFKGSVRGLKALQNNVNTQLKKGMTGTQLQEANAVMAPIDILVSHEGAPDRARVEYYKNLIRNGKKVDPIVIVNEGAKYGIDDGKHRFQAYKELGYNQVPTIFKGGEEYRQMMARADSRFNLPSKSIPKELEGLAAEARKYKSAEEFVKAQQFKKISAENPMIDTYHTGIRNISDIKTFKETLSDPESFVNPDFTKEMAKKAFESGEIMVYSSKPLDKSLSQFVTPSKMMASDYAGSGEVYSKKVNVNDVAWISGDEGNLVGKSQLTDIWNQANKGLQGAESSVKLPVEPQIKVVNGKVKVKMKPISVPNQESPALGVPPNPNIPPEEDPVQKIIQAIKEAKPLRKEQEALYTAERSKRLGQVIGVGKNMKGEAGYFGQLSKLKGELPKVQFEPIRTNLKQGEIDQLFNRIRDSKYITEWEKINAQTGLSKLLGKEGGMIPTEGEIGLLSEVFGKDFVQAILDKRSTGAKLLDIAGNILNVPRTVMASFDLSAPFRQGWGLMGKPKQFGGAFKEMFNYFRSEEGYNAMLQSIKDHPNYLKMREGKLSLAQQGPLLTGREERFMSNYAEQIPGVGRMIRGSDRAYTGFLNKLRSDSFNDMLDKAIASGAPDSPDTYKAIANFINTATGRGSLGELNKASMVLSNALFSPRLMASRFQMMNPMTYASLPPQVRQQALRAVLGSAAIALSAVGMAKMAGAEVGTDPRSADFGKIKIGNTRYDMWAGFQQPVRALSQIISGKVISTTTGREMTLGEGYKPMTRLDIVWNFLQSKESPVASFILGMLQGQNGIGQPFNVPEEVISRVTPMILSDMFDLYQEHGLKGLPMALPGIFGVGSQTYSWSPTSKSDKMQAAAMKEGGASNKDINNYLLEQTRRKVQIQQQKDELKKQTEPPIQDIPSTAPKTLEQAIWEKVKGIIPNAEAGGINPSMSIPDQGKPTTQIPTTKTKNQTSIPSGVSSSMQMDIQEEGIKNNLKYSNKYVESIGGKLYIKQQDGSVKVISLGSSKPTGNIIQQAKQQTNKESAIKSAGVSTYFRTDMPDAEKLQVYKALGTNASDVELKALASLDDNQQASVLYSLLKDRQWKQEKVDAFIKSDVLTNSVVSKMEQQGLINSNQATQLKNYIKSTNVKLGKARASKPKKLKIPKLKKISVKKTKLKIKLPKAPTAKLLKPKAKSSKYFS